jgi:hypothetical protein
VQPAARPAPQGLVRRAYGRGGGARQNSAIEAGRSRRRWWAQLFRAARGQRVRPSLEQSPSARLGPASARMSVIVVPWLLLASINNRFVIACEGAAVWGRGMGAGIRCAVYVGSWRCSAACNGGLTIVGPARTISAVAPTLAVPQSA